MYHKPAMRATAIKAMPAMLSIARACYRHPEEAAKRPSKGDGPGR
jgi:hypothetical protein